MKNLILLIALLSGFSRAKAQKVEDANVYPTNLEENMWWESFDSNTRTFKGVNFMVLSDGNNSEHLISPFNVKLYLYQAGKDPIFIKTWRIENMKHFMSKEYKNLTISFKDIDVPSGTWRLGLFVDADDEVKEDNGDNAMLFKKDVIIKDLPAEQTTTPVKEDKQEGIQSDPEPAVDELQDAKNNLTNSTKNLATKEFEYKNNKAKMSPYEQKLAELEIEELKYTQEKNKLALERVEKTKKKTINIDKQQEFVAKEQELELKANQAAKQRSELAAVKTQNSDYTRKMTDYDNQIATKESQISAAKPMNKVDSIDLDIRKNELEELRYRKNAAAFGKERTEKAMAMTIADQENARLKGLEDDNNKQAEQSASKVRNLYADKKQAEKDAKKADNKAKVDNSKLKVKIKVLKQEIASNEKSLNKEKAKKKQNPEKIAQLEKDLAEKKTRLAEMEAQLR
ncbi:MAG TPA: hypothetical protein PLR45_04680 [Flavobacteriales bacterium]|nr:hypothetical protein [Flavobacteriales bacterium]